ncbi:thermonuclease family protein [Spongiibacter taiwanensis]|uniref:thermonuclease family protein n=1 Tax=Spongiibacter taiwanensis TaxID=1748242 RepID=UPI002034A929|nr:thermonuclease family protein [Spongiibacter taiwanensis]USA41664.1 thermonuclease family protein [Spongiibacter taiwanensis]
MSITDGDTLRLGDGRRLRLLAINAPELGREGRSDDPFAVTAKQTLAAKITNQRVFLHDHGEDRYGRRLVSVFQRADGGHLGAEMLAAGMAWYIAVPPQVSPYRACLRRIEAMAAAQKIGVWSQPALRSTALTMRDQGFQRVTGRLLRIDRSRSAMWLEMEGDLVLRLANADRPHFSQDLDTLVGRQLEVRGWLMSRRPPRPEMARFKMDLRHPDMLNCLDCP